MVSSALVCNDSGKLAGPGVDNLALVVVAVGADGAADIVAGAADCERARGNRVVVVDLEVLHAGEVVGGAKAWEGALWHRPRLGGVDNAWAGAGGEVGNEDVVVAHAAVGASSNPALPSWAVARVVVPQAAGLVLAGAEVLVAGWGWVPLPL